MARREPIPPEQIVFELDGREYDYTIFSTVEIDDVWRISHGQQLWDGPMFVIARSNDEMLIIDRTVSLSEFLERLQPDLSDVEGCSWLYFVLSWHMLLGESVEERLPQFRPSYSQGCLTVYGTTGCFYGIIECHTINDQYDIDIKAVHVSTGDVVVGMVTEFRDEMVFVVAKERAYFYNPVVELDDPTPNHPEAYVGRFVQFEVIGLDSERGCVIGSRRSLILC